MSNEDFDWSFYTKAYPDLINMSRRNAFWHYKTNGKKEGRLAKKPNLPDDFDWLAYITFNPDLKDIKNFESAAVHYIKYGQFESRITNIKTYIEKNKKNEILGDYKGKFESILEKEAKAFLKISEYNISL